jgi:microcystin-dependent protein
MNSKLLFLSFLMLLTVTTNYAQSSAEQAGIAVQGIARDGNNTALVSQSISLTFELYYLNSASAENRIYIITENLQTDPFGVFSYIIDPTAVNNEKFANYQAWLRIKKGNDIISNEKLNHVPYAISANNGVPTGSIMPFIGTVAPYGWALCNGGLLPITATELIAMVGANAPNLQGMFLRGAGTSPVNSQPGPTLKTTQNDSYESHLHGVGSLAIGSSDLGTNVPSSPNPWYTSAWTNGDNPLSTVYNGIGADNPRENTTGVHGHSISGSTANTGANETRPVNYGVNYIIKL